MSMFCFQCQETAKGTGCEIKGVCGKPEDVAKLQDLLVYTIKEKQIKKMLAIRDDLMEKGNATGLSDAATFEVSTREANVTKVLVDTFGIGGMDTVDNIEYSLDSLYL